MVFTILHSEGWGESDPPVGSLPALLDELKAADQEHGDVSVMHEETGWCLSAHRDGRVTFVQISKATRGGPKRHMIPVAREKILELWHHLIRGEIDAVLREPWRPGYQ